MTIKDYIETILQSKTVETDKYDVKEKNGASDDELEEDKE